MTIIDYQLMGMMSRSNSNKVLRENFPLLFF